MIFSPQGYPNRLLLALDFRRLSAHTSSRQNARYPPPVRNPDARSLNVLTAPSGTKIPH